MTLYLVATPIGNLQDFTFRAKEVLSNVDYILCEDTRHSSHLLNHYQIHTPLKSFHRFNEREREDLIIQDLKQGKEIALISDAGTPGISDPGEVLVSHCVEEGILVTSIPGACAAIAAVSISGFSTEKFQFVGFLPKKTGDLKKQLIDVLSYTGTTVCYESPHRILNVLDLLKEIAPDRKMAIARELTKKFEEIKRGTPAELLDYWKEEPRGEIVLIISESKSKPDWINLTPLEHVDLLERLYQISKLEAIKLVAEIRGVSKRNIYNEIHR